MSAPKSLADMTAEVHAWCETKGWHPSTNTFGDCMALMHSEVSEALEAFRDHGVTDATDYQTAIDAHHDARAHGICEHGELRGECDKLRVIPKPEGVGSEFADVLIRLLDNCHMYDIDLAAEYERKMAYNRTRLWKHGGRAL